MITVLVTGGAGFIGSTLVRELLVTTDARVVTLDALTYAGHLASLTDVTQHERHHFEHADITDEEKVAQVFAAYQPDAVLHLAAESHVDRSIDGPEAFLRTNVHGTYVLLEAARKAWKDRTDTRFVHVSTDEVFGSLAPGDPAFDAETPYDPRSPYSASKAASDHLARAWFHTYGLPTIVTNCTNNYGPRQHPEKFIPTMILRGARGDALPIYGDGAQVRDWLHVQDHAQGLIAALQYGELGETYLFGAREERRNLDVVQAITSLLDQRMPNRAPHADRIAFVPDRPGHDVRYAIDPSTSEQQLHWSPTRTFDEGLAETVDWYLRNMDWVEQVVGSDAALGRQGLGQGDAP